MKACHAMRVRLAVLGTVTGLACVLAPGVVAQGFAERDSAGVTIVEVGAPVAEWSVAPEPVVRIGVLDGAQSYLFHGVEFAARLADGRILVLNRGDAQVRFFDPSGEHRSTLGGDGRGPGEFTHMSSTRLMRGDTLVVYDMLNQRITVINPDESIGRMHPVGGMSAFARSPQLLGLMSDGRAVVVTRPTPTSWPQEAGYTYVRDTLHIVATRLEAGATPDRIGVLAGDQGLKVAFRLSSGGLGIQQGAFPIPFGFDGHHELLNDHVLLASSDRPEFRLTDGGGVVTRIIRRTDVTPVNVTTALKERYLEHQLESLPPEPARAEARREEFATFLAAVRAGQTLPAFDRIMVSSGDGQIWVRDYELPWNVARGRTWTVYAAEGRPTAQIETPAGLNILHIGYGYVTGVLVDALGIEYVTVYRLLY